MNATDTTADRKAVKAARKAERKAAKALKLPFMQFGKMETGAVNTGFRGRTLNYNVKDHHHGLVQVELDPMTVQARIETAEEATKHMKAGRVGGGLIVGGVLLGPLGAALGGGIGAAARKSYADKFLVLEGPGGKTYSVLLKGRLEMINAEALIESVRKVQRNAAQQETAE